jgi:hypothetical protein
MSESASAPVAAEAAATPVQTADASPSAPAVAETPATPLDAPLVSPVAKEGDTPPVEAAKTEEPKAPEAEKPMDPADYVVELPEGFSREDPLLQKFLEGAARGRMDNESVSEIVKSLAPEMSERINAPMKAWVELNTAWKKEIMEDADIGGETFAKSVLPTIQTALEQHGDPKIFEALHVTGAGNHPAVVRTLWQLSRLVTEAGTTPVQPGSPVAANSRAAAMYPSAKATP